MTRSIFFGFLFLTLFALSVRAQLPRCNMIPNMLTAGMSQLIFSPNECLLIKDVGTIYIDYISQMSRVDLSAVAGNTQTTLSSWINYNTKMMYTLDRENEQCTSMPYQGPVLSNTLPSSAVYTGSAYFGIQQIDTYWVSGAPGYPEYGSEMAVTTDTCFPFSASIMNMTGMPTVWITEGFWNVIPTIPVGIFDLPSSCSSTKLIKKTVPAQMHSRFVPSKMIHML